MHQIKLYCTADGWIAKHTDPKVKELFGSDVLPTAYTVRADKEFVLASIQDLNPDREVVFGASISE